MATVSLRKQTAFKTKKAIEEAKNKKRQPEEIFDNVDDLMKDLLNAI